MYEELLQNPEFTDSEVQLTFPQFLALTEPITGYDSANFPLLTSKNWLPECSKMQIFPSLDITAD